MPHDCRRGIPSGLHAQVRMCAATQVLGRRGHQVERVISAPDHRRFVSSLLAIMLYKVCIFKSPRLTALFAIHNTVSCTLVNRLVGP